MNNTEEYDANKLVVASLEIIHSVPHSSQNIVESTNQKYIFEIVDEEKHIYKNLFTNEEISDQACFDKPFLIGVKNLTSYIKKYKNEKLRKINLLWILNDINFKLKDEIKDNCIEEKKKIEYNDFLLDKSNSFALLKLKNSIKDKCPIHNVFKGCTIIDCLNCENCAYKIDYNCSEIFDDYVTYAHSNYHKLYDNINSEEIPFIIEFIDYVPFIEDIESYLLNYDSDYRIVGLNDGVVYRKCLKERMEANAHDEIEDIINRIAKSVSDNILLNESTSKRLFKRTKK